MKINSLMPRVLIYCKSGHYENTPQIEHHVSFVFVDWELRKFSVAAPRGWCSGFPKTHCRENAVYGPILWE